LGRALFAQSKWKCLETCANSSHLLLCLLENVGVLIFIEGKLSAQAEIQAIKCFSVKEVANSIDRVGLRRANVALLFVFRHLLIDSWAPM